jgi:hypothetical protein
MNRKAPRTMYRTPKGTKRLLKRNAKGKFTDNQKWKNVTRADQRQKSAAELEADAKKAEAEKA